MREVHQSGDPYSRFVEAVWAECDPVGSTCRRRQQRPRRPHRRIRRSQEQYTFLARLIPLRFSSQSHSFTSNPRPQPRDRARSWPVLCPGDVTAQPVTLAAVDRRTVELRIAGQSYRVVSSAPEEELKRLALVVSAKLAELVPKGRPLPPQAMLLAAMALAHDVEEARTEQQSLQLRTRDLLRRTLVRIDDALEPFEEVESVSSE